MLMRELYLVPDSEAIHDGRPFEFTPDSLPPYEGTVDRADMHGAIGELLHDLAKVMSDQRHYLEMGMTWGDYDWQEKHKEQGQLELQLKGMATVLKVVAPLHKTWGELWPETMRTLKVKGYYPMLHSGPPQIAELSEVEDGEYEKASEYQAACNQPCDWEAWITHAARQVARSIEHQD
jgi:hypothetical protein